MMTSTSKGRRGAGLQIWRGDDLHKLRLMMQRMGATCGKGRRVTTGMRVDGMALVGRLTISKAGMGKEERDGCVLDYGRRGC
jgi:hypothetical protein